MTVSTALVHAAAALLVLSIGGCRGDRDAVMLKAPFNENTEIGALTAVWSEAGDERAFANAQRLDEPEVRFRFRVDAKNDLEDRLYIRVGNFQLVDGDGLPLGASDAEIACTLNAGTTDGILSGEVWIPKKAVKKIDGFRIAHFAVPLSDRGRSLYREWLLQEKAQQPGQVDPELAGYAAAPPCIAR